MLNFQWPVWESESDNTKSNTPAPHSHIRPCNTNESHDTGERFLVIQIPGLHNFSGPEVGQSHWVHGEKGPAEDVLPLKKIRKQKNRKLRRVVRTAERIIGTTPPTLQELCLSRVSKRSGKITLDPHIQHAHSLNCYRLVDATELWAPERPDTETVSSLRQSISWTLDNKVEHTTLLYIIYPPHILIYISNLYISYLYIHNCLLYIVVVFFFLHYFVYLYIIIFLLSGSCAVAVFLLHCGASVTITNSLYL